MLWEPHTISIKYDNGYCETIDMTKEPNRLVPLKNCKEFFPNEERGRDLLRAITRQFADTALRLSVQSYENERIN